MATAEFGLLGAMRLRVGGVPVRLPGPAERGLLALLLLSPRQTVPASSLVDRLWNETSLPVDPLNALQLRVSKLRRALVAQGVDVVVRETTGYRADVDPDHVDLHRFVRGVAAARAGARSGPEGTGAALARYDAALGLWRGEPLADFADLSWATVEAARLHQLRLAALTERAELALAAGRHLEVVSDLEPVVAEDPRQEALVGLLMTALSRSGRQADALSVYARTRRCLAEELGLEPSAALRALHQRVLQQDADLAAVPRPVAAPPSAAPAGAAAESDAPAPAAPELGNVAARRLPVPAVRLIGRDTDIGSICDVLSAERLVSLVGPGGAGKTALALTVAHRVADRFTHAVHLVRLAPVSEPDDVPMAVADALGVPLDGADPRGHLRDRLLTWLATRRLLLVVDNCEHVVDAVARLVDRILAAAPGVTVLATSREALAVPGEVQVAVGPLEVPPGGTPPERVLEYPAPRLFAERARAVRSRLELGESDLRALARVCTQLDGMPLALELAAARMSSLSLVELAERLHDRFGLLTTGPRTAEARQRTLRATVEWSHALLSDAEGAVFRRLAVFSGGWTLSAAEAVVAGGKVRAGEVLDVLGRLVNRSLVVCDVGHPTRYRMLETLRQFAREQLERSGEQDQVAGRHAAFYRQFADEAELTLRGRGQRETLRRLREEHSNLRAALTWLSADRSRIDDALHLAGALGLFWHLGRHLEGREVLGALVDVPGGSIRARARALQAVSIVERPRACLVHPSPRCAETARESLELFVAEGDVHRAALSRVLLAVELLDGSDPRRLEELLSEAEEQFSDEDDEWGHAVIAFVRLQNYLRRGDRQRALTVGRAAVDAFRHLEDAWGLSAVLYHLGWGLKEFGEYAEAVPVLEQAIEVSTSAGLFNTAQWALGDLGHALLCLGETDAAVRCLDRAHAASEEIGDAAGEALASLGRATMAQIAGDAAGARPLFEAALDGLTRLGPPLWAGSALAGIAWCDWREGLLLTSLGRYEQVRETGVATGEPTLVATGLEGLARVAAARGETAESAGYLTRAAAIRQAAARPAPPHERAELSALTQGELVLAIPAEESVERGGHAGDPAIDAGAVTTRDRPGRRPGVRGGTSGP